MEQNQESQFRVIGLVIMGQTAIGIILIAVVLYDFFSGSSLFGPPLGEGLLFEPSSYILWVVSGFLLIFYLLIQRAFRNVDDGKEMPFLKFWVRQIHHKGDSSVMAMLLVPSSLGEATVILSLLLYLFGGRDPVLFLPGMLAGSAGNVFFTADCPGQGESRRS